VGKEEKIIFQGEELNGEELEFTTKKDVWNVLKTEDGATLKLKTVVTKIVRAEKYNEDTGEPLYVVNSQNIVVVSDIPEELKKKSKK
jgi:ribosomal protein L13